MYAQQLRPFFASFPRENLLVLKFEDIATCPEELALRVHAFLGLGSRPHDAVGLGLVNPAVDEGCAVIPRDVERVLLERYREPNVQLAQLLGPGFEVW